MENIFTTSKSFINLAQALGIFPLSYSGAPCEGVLKPRLLNYGVSCCMFFIIVALMFANFKSGGLTLGNSKIIDTAWYILSNTEYIATMVLFLNQILKKNYIMDFLKAINTFDMQVFDI